MVLGGGEREEVEEGCELGKMRLMRWMEWESALMS